MMSLINPGGLHATRDTRHPQLALDPQDGAVWLARGRVLQRVNATGQVEKTIPFEKKILAISVDSVRSRVWVTVQGARLARAFAASGTEVASLDPEGRGRVTDLAYDPVLDRLWLTLNQQEIASFTPEGKPDFRKPGLRFKPGWLTPDGYGGAWFADDGQTLVHLNAEGNTLAKVRPFKKGQGPLRTLEADPGDRSLWVAAADGLVQLAADGTVLLQLDPDKKVKEKEDKKEQDGKKAKDNIKEKEVTNPLVMRALRAMALQRVTEKPPELAFTAPAEGAWIHTHSPAFGLTYTGKADPKTLTLKVGETALAVNCQWTDQSAICTPTTPLSEGSVRVSATIATASGNMSPMVERTVNIDSLPPVITATPASGLITNQAALTLAGSVNEEAVVTVNGTAVALGVDRSFTYPVTLVTGNNAFILTAQDRAGNTGGLNLTVTLDTVAPGMPLLDRVTVSESVAGQVTITGGTGSVEGGAQVTLTNVASGATSTVQAQTNGAFTATLAAKPGEVIRLGAVDAAGNAGQTATAAVIGLPPDPIHVAPPADTTLPATRIDQTTAFLYTGDNPIQTGVAPQAIQPQRAAVVRGGVNEAAGAPLSGVQVTLPGHPELGQTLSRNDGKLDLAVNGGETLTVRFEKAGYLPVDRQIKPDWQGWAHLPDVVLTPLDTKVTPVDLAATTPLQVVQGSPVTDGDGTRQATLLFPQGTAASMVLPDGSSQPLTTLNVRATEYTVGPTGPKAMPAALPATSGYTYAVELSVDEALAAKAKEVRFDRPVPVYVDNFLQFPVGGAVPVGYYDRDKKAWIPSNDGRVISVLSKVNGLAQLDVSGNGQAADAAALASLGITAAEQEKLAQLYEPGQSLWRVQVTHFSPWDCNWPVSPPANAKPPFPTPRAANDPPVPSPKVDAAREKNDTQCGSVISCQNQVLGETIPVAGTPFSLHYSSERVPGRQGFRTMTIPISGVTVPAEVKRIELEVRVAGRQFKNTFAPTPNQTHLFTWDGLDAYGRPAYGRQAATVDVGYIYQAVYNQPADNGRSFGMSTGMVTGNRARDEITLWNGWQAVLGIPFDATNQKLGGWTFSPLHAYDSVTKTLFTGDGGSRSASIVNNIVTTVAGDGTQGYSGDGGLAINAKLGHPQGIAVGPDGSIYFTENPDTAHNRVRRIGPDGIVTTFAGTGVAGFSGDGGPATAAKLNMPQGLAVGPDGSVYIADEENYRVRRVDPNGIITTFAGKGRTGGWYFAGDNGPAVEAYLTVPSDVAVSSDGTVYIADSYNFRIRKVTPDGIITTVAGNGTRKVGSDGTPALQSGLFNPNLVAVGQDGSIFIGDSQVYKVGPDGRISRYAGGSNYGYGGGDGGPAPLARLQAFGMDVMSDGNLLVSDRFNIGIRRVGSNGIITTLAGNGAAGFNGDGLPATQTSFNYPYGVAVAGNGSIYVPDSENHRIRRIAPPYPGFLFSDLAIPSQDGRELYRFDEKGRHLATFNPLTGAQVYRFEYDNAGHLIRVVDGDGDITTIEREAHGN
ncbi:MAG: hypothetical protein HQL65_17485, partial [Magnetococcales bacterium]|nr:hypothetical protein [Magnetococcales bacterium]